MIGIDIIKISRFNRIKKDNFPYWQKIFHKSEWVYCFNSARPKESLAGIFAAKEAVLKVLDSKFSSNFKIIKIFHNHSGQPLVKLARSKNINIYISISHDNNIAIAVAVLI